MVYPNDVPYLAIFPRVVTMPRGASIPITETNPNGGKPITREVVQGGRGNLILFYTDSVEDTIKEINNPKNFITKRTDYKRYFYNLIYSGKLRSKRYYFKDVEKRKEIYGKVKKVSGIIPMPLLSLSGQNQNTFFEMSRYVEIYHSIMDKFDTASRVRVFWEYMSQILNMESLKGYVAKYIIINAENYSDAFKGTLKENLSNPLFMIYYTMFRYPELIQGMDQDIFIYYNTKCFRVNLSQVDRGRGATRFRQLLTLLMPHKEKEISNCMEVSEIEKSEKIEHVERLLNNKYNFTGDEDDTEVLSLAEVKPEEDDKKKKKKDTEQDEITKRLSEIAARAVADTETPEDAEAKAQEELENDRKLIEDMYKKAVADNHTSQSTASTARDKKIREEQGKIKVANSTIEQLQAVKSTHMPIMTTDVSKNLTTTNKNMKSVTFHNFEKTYNEKVFPKDMVNAFAALNNKSLPMTIIKYDVKDTSDELNYKDTYTVVLEDSNRQRHTISVDIPKFIDDRFMWIGGSKKIITYQSFLYPVIKSGPDKVQIVTNYNKMFIERFGTKSITSLERLNKIIASNSDVANCFTPGRSYELNASYITTIEYDELSKRYARFKSGNTVIFFNQKEALEEAEKSGVTIGSNDIFIGFKGDIGLLIDQDTQRTDTDKSIVDLIIDSLPDAIKDEFEKVKAPKRLLYSVATTMQQKVSLGLLLGFWGGLSSVTGALGLKYRLETKAPKALKSNESMIRFKDCYMVYTENVAQSLIMNGFRVIETNLYNITEFETKDPYMDYLYRVYGKRSIANALMNVYEFTIDPITLEILQDQKLPTEMIPLCVYANSLLADSQYTADYDQHLCRIRTSEIIPSILYDCIAKQYIVYKNSNGKKKLSLQKDIVIKKLLDLKTVEDYSTLNPILEMQLRHKVLYKGWRGINSDRTYTQDKRVYDKSMIGIIGLSSSPDGSVGVQKILSWEPNVTSARGYLKITDNEKELKDVNLFSPAETLVPLGVTRDDPTRTGFRIVARLKLL